MIDSTTIKTYFSYSIVRYSQMVRPSFLVRVFKGSSPFTSKSPKELSKIYSKFVFSLLKVFEQSIIVVENLL